MAFKQSRDQLPVKTLANNKIRKNWVWHNLTGNRLKFKSRLLNKKNKKNNIKITWISSLVISPKLNKKFRIKIGREIKIQNYSNRLKSKIIKFWYKTGQDILIKYVDRMDKIQK